MLSKLINSNHLKNILLCVFQCYTSRTQLAQFFCQSIRIKWYLTIVLVCTFMIVKEVEYNFFCLYATSVFCKLQSMGSRGVGHDWATSLSLFTFMHWRRKWQPTPLFLPGESQGLGSLVGCRLWGCTELDKTEATQQQQQQQQQLLLICNSSLHILVTRFCQLHLLLIPFDFVACVSLFVIFKNYVYVSLWLLRVLAVAHRLAVAACGVQFPGQGWNLGPLH